MVYTVYICVIACHVMSCSVMVCYVMYACVCTYLLIYHLCVFLWIPICLYVLPWVVWTSLSVFAAIGSIESLASPVHIEDPSGRLRSCLQRMDMD